MDQNKSRSWVFTLNNYSEDERLSLIDIIQSEQVVYGVFGKEVGENGTPHLQGYIEFKSPRMLSGLKKNVNGRAHWEKRMGSKQQAAAYCKKDGDFFEHGELADKPSERSDLKRARLEVLDVGMRGIVAEYSLQQIQVAEKVLMYATPKERVKPVVYWYYGSTGTGKSRRAHYEAKKMFGDDFYRKSTNNKWWNGYDGHKGVIIDDFRPSWWALTEMLDLLDRYAKLVEVKGGMRSFTPTHIWVTSCRAPHECYTGEEENIAQLTRRIDHVVKFDEGTCWEPPMICEQEMVSIDSPVISQPASPATPLNRVRRAYANSMFDVITPTQLWNVNDCNF